MRITLSVLFAFLYGPSFAQLTSVSLPLCDGKLGEHWNNCVGTHSFAWGGRYEGEWKGGRMHGNGKEFAKSGELVRQGLWENGTYIGSSTPSVETKKFVIEAVINLDGCVKPVYPVEAIDSKSSGTTEVQYQLGADGKIAWAYTFASSGNTLYHSLLDGLVEKEIKKCSGTPRIENGLKIPSNGRYRYEWKIPDAAPTAIRGNQSIDFSKCEAPTKTVAAKRAGAHGNTVVQYLLSVDGSVAVASVLKSSGNTREHKQLDRMSIEAVRACKGKPSTISNSNTYSLGAVDYVFPQEKAED